MLVPVVWGALYLELAFFVEEFKATWKRAVALTLPLLLMLTLADDAGLSILGRLITRQLQSDDGIEDQLRSIDLRTAYRLWAASRKIVPAVSTVSMQ
jgi:hypothetical protein